MKVMKMVYFGYYDKECVRSNLEGIGAKSAILCWPLENSSRYSIFNLTISRIALIILLAT